MFATTRKDFAVLLMIMIIRMSSYFSSFYALLLVIVIRIMAAVKSEGKSERNKKQAYRHTDTQRKDDSR